MSSYTYLGNNSTALGASIAMTTTGVVPSGGLVIARVAGNYAGLGAMTVTDAAGLTWTKGVEHIHSTSDPACAIWSAPAPSGKAIGTITGTLASGTAALTIDAIYVSNPAGSPLDATPTKGSEGLASTAVTSGTTASPSTTDWVGITCISNHGAAFRTTTPQGSWTEDTDSGATAGGEMQSIIGTTTTAMQGAGTLSASADWSCVVAVYKLTSGGAAVKHNFMLLGVGS